MAKQAFKFLIDLPMQNRWENVDLMRNSVLNCFTAIFQEMEGVHVFATVAAELLENAIKYGRWEEDAPAHLRLRVWGDSTAAHVEVEHPVDSSSAEVKELRDTIAWLRSFATPEDAYRARLLDVAQSPKGVSKLGLARIAYEGRCTLDVTLEGEMLRVTSVTQL